MWGPCKLRSAFLQNSAVSTKPSPTLFWLFISFKLNEPIFYSPILYLLDLIGCPVMFSFQTMHSPVLEFPFLFIMFISSCSSACPWHWPETDPCAVAWGVGCLRSLLKWSPDYWPPSELVWDGVEDCYLKTLIWGSRRFRTRDAQRQIRIGYTPWEFPERYLSIVFLLLYV